MKAIAYGLLYGKKSSLQLTDRWLNDELARSGCNPNATHYKQVVSAAVLSEIIEHACLEHSIMPNTNTSILPLRRELSV